MTTPNCRERPRQSPVVIEAVPPPTPSQTVFDPEISLELEIDPDLLKIQFEPGLLDLPNCGGRDDGRG